MRPSGARVIRRRSEREQRLAGAFRRQACTYTFHHPEKLLRDGGDDEAV
ncbi:hypothetical protein OCU_40340 [Mycobacterium intracellulare ATCC 13950]|uniref:Uncharacterized protein n=1 Tax=Mycobacterium intracellulare (strain ATCC 13950 / DSM 43223 / JCM 6384 / NCTC 13025 / 3600) TaxID=487521 RepID=H8IN70_MYCIA|nr:hypothetical protein OCU_40340 [Mycobacterium intracellulare ATCC 13950]